MRCRFGLYIYGYVVMPEHVHLLLSEPQRGLLADAIHYLTLSFAKRLVAQVRARFLGANSNLVAQVRAPVLGANLGSRSNVFWQKRYYDRKVRNEREFVEKLRYLHRNPVKAGLCQGPEDWKWSSFRHYVLREKGIVQIESEWTARDRERQAQEGAERIFLIPG